MPDEKDKEPTYLPPSPLQEQFASLMNRLELARTRWEGTRKPGMLDAPTNHLTEAQRLLGIMMADSSKIPDMIESFRSRIEYLEKSLS